jgi:hypothetical protein
MARRIALSGAWSNPESQAEDTMPLPPGYHPTEPTVEMRREFRRRGDDLRGAFGICRGLLFGVTLWAIVWVVAVSVGSTGDARDMPRAPAAPIAATPHTTVTIDRGGRTYER